MTQGTMDAIMLFMHFVFLYEFSNYISVMLCYVTCHVQNLCYVSNYVESLCYVRSYVEKNSRSDNE